MKLFNNKSYFFYAATTACILTVNSLIAQPSSHPSTINESLVFNNESSEELVIPDNFYNNWNTVHVMIHRSEFSALPENLPINLKEGNSEFAFPVKGQLLGQFCYRGRQPHTGVDIGLKKGTPVYSTFDGVVRMAKNYGGYGKLVVVRHLNGLETVYAHLSKIKVKVNQKVKAGDIVGLGGRTGKATANHLHFETRYNGAAFNPMEILDFDTYTLKSDTLVLFRTAFLPKFKIIRSRHHGKRAVEMNYNEEGKLVTEKEGAIASKSTSDTLMTNAPVAENPIVEKSAGKNRKRTVGKSSKTHAVKKGETLGHIARENHTTITKLSKLNGISAKKKLKIGQKIRVK